MRNEPQYPIDLYELQEMYDDHLDGQQAPFQLGDEVIRMGEAFKKLFPAIYSIKFREWLEDERLSGRVKYDQYHDRYYA